jgi:predicted MFS family arabinose efflux permease
VDLKEGHLRTAEDVKEIVKHAADTLSASFLGVLLVLVRWRRIPHQTTLPAERLLGAMRAGLRYARHSPVFQAVLVRTAAFFLFASDAWGFLPLIVRQRLGAGPATYGLLLGAIGAGAIAGAFLLPRVRAWLSRDALVAIATLFYALATLALAHLRDVALLTGAMLLMGAAWVMVLSSLQVSVQTALPEWVRARGLSLYLVVFMGGMAGGSLLWGQLATQTDLVIALETAAGGALAGVLMTLLFRIGLHEAVDLAPSAHWPQPHVVEAV